MTTKTVLVTNKTNIRYWSGFAGTAGYIALHGNKQFLFTDARYHLVARSVIPKNCSLIDITSGFDEAWKSFIKKYRIKKVGVEEKEMSVHFWKKLKKISGGVVFSDVSDELNKKRIIKKPFELKALEEAQQITDRILATLKKSIRVGMSEKEIAWDIEKLAREYGAEDISFPPIVGINEHTASPHHHPTDKKVKQGDLILIDMGVIYLGYCSDMTRVLFTKAPTAEQKKVYEIVLKAQERAIQKLHGGVRGNKGDAFARDFIKKEGYGDYFGHSLGHGVGLDIHELPNLSSRYKEAIPAGTVVTVEPGIYLPGKFGVRLEDMVFVGKKGVRNLTKSPKSIQQSIIRIK